MPIWRTYQSISKPKKFSKVFEYTNIRYGLKSNSIQNGGNKIFGYYTKKTYKSDSKKRRY